MAVTSRGESTGPRGQVSTTSVPESVNWYVTSSCNYECKFCFFTNAGFLRSIGKPAHLHLPKEQSFKLLAMLKGAGTKKLTFAGGEPTFYPLLPELIAEAKRLGMVTMIVTNGTGITDKFLDAVAGKLDVIKFSVDSPSNETEAKLGRGNGKHIDQVLAAAEKARGREIGIMLNTVVTNLNRNEDMHDLVRRINPQRWKVFQVLPKFDMNAKDWNEMVVSERDFLDFVRRHQDLSPIAEDNKTMIDSYVIIDPIGRFMQDGGSRTVYSSPILEAGVMPALAEVGWNFPMYLKRGGRYFLPAVERRPGL